MFKGTARIVRRINKDTLHLPRKLLLQRLQRQQVVAEDQAVVEDVAFADTVGRVVAAAGVFEQNARFQARAVFLADPGQFEFGFAWGH